MDPSLYPLSALKPQRVTIMPRYSGMPEPTHIVDRSGLVLWIGSGHEAFNVLIEGDDDKRDITPAQHAAVHMVVNLALMDNPLADIIFRSGCYPWDYSDKFND